MAAAQSKHHVQRAPQKLLLKSWNVHGKVYIRTVDTRIHGSFDMQDRLHSTSTAAVASNSNPSYVHRLIALGVIRPMRDLTGRFILSEADVETIKAHRAKKITAAA